MRSIRGKSAQETWGNHPAGACKQVSKNKPVKKKKKKLTRDESPGGHHQGLKLT